jgi:hypothetical protein
LSKTENKIFMMEELKAAAIAALAATPGQDAIFIAAANPAVVLALLEALENRDSLLTESEQALEDAKRRIAELKSDLSEWEDCKHEGSSWYDFSGHERCGKCGADK